MKKIIALKRDTVLGPLTVWFGPKAVEFAESHEGVIMCRYANPETYASDQLDRFLSGQKLDPDVEVLDVKNEVPYLGPKRHPLSEPVVDQKPTGASGKYEPVGTTPVVGDFVTMPNRNYGDDTVTEVDVNVATGGEIGQVFLDKSTYYWLSRFHKPDNDDGHARIIKRKAADE